MAWLLIWSWIVNVGVAPSGKRLSEHEQSVIMSHVRRGASIGTIATWFGYHKKTIERLIERYNNNGTGEYYTEPSGGRKPRWNSTHAHHVVSMVNRNATIYLFELRDRLYALTGDIFSITTIWRYLHKYNFTNKIITRRFKEANPLLEIGFWFALSGNNVNINQLIWYDESYICRLSGNRTRGWSLKYV